MSAPEGEDWFHRIGCVDPPLQLSPPIGETRETTGVLHTVSKLQLYGSGTSGYPAVSVPDRIWTAYTVQAEKGAAWLRVTVVFEMSQVSLNGNAGTKVHVTLVVFMGSLNTATMEASRAMLVAPSGGAVETTNGLPQAVVNGHGFGRGPGTSGFPSLSVPLIITVKRVQAGNGVACE